MLQRRTVKEAANCGRGLRGKAGAPAAIPPGRTARVDLGPLFRRCAFPHPFDTMEHPWHLDLVFRLRPFCSVRCGVGSHIKAETRSSAR